MGSGKKIVAGILSSVMIFSAVIVSNAAEKELISGEQIITVEKFFDRQQIILLMEILNDVECQKSIIGLSEVDFAALKIGAPVQTYNYVDNTFKEARKMYPITYNNKLVLWIIDNGGQFQVTTALVNEVNSAIEDNVPFSIVYDRSSSYLYANDNFVLVGSSALQDMTRAVLEPDSIMSRGDLKTTALTENTALGYKASTNSDLVCASAYAKSAPIYYECGVSYVSQNPPSALCWAASVASIANYCKGKSLNAVTVAKGYYGATDYNYGINPFEAPAVLGNYDLTYSYKYEVPSDNVILENIVANYPIYGNFVVGLTTHAGVIYGTNVMSGYIYIMDPEFGFTSASKGTNGYYSYTSGYSGTTVTLISASCYSW